MGFRGRFIAGRSEVPRKRRPRPSPPSPMHFRAEVCAQFLDRARHSCASICLQYDYGADERKLDRREARRRVRPLAAPPALVHGQPPDRPSHAVLRPPVGRGRAFDRYTIQSSTALNRIAGMKPVTVEATVSKPPSEVYEFLDLLANHERFTDHWLVEWEFSGRKRGVGAKARARANTAGSQDWTEFEVVEAEALTRLALRARSDGGRRTCAGRPAPGASAGRSPRAGRRGCRSAARRRSCTRARRWRRR